MRFMNDNESPVEVEIHFKVSREELSNILYDLRSVPNPYDEIIDLIKYLERL